MRRLRFPLVILALVSACSAPQLDVTPRYGQLGLDGEFGASSGSVSGTADLEAMGLDDDESIPGLRADLSISGPHLILSAASAGWKGDGTLDVDLTANGQTITAGTDVRSDLDVDFYSGALLWDIAPTSIVEVAIGVGVTALDFDILVTGGGDTIESDELVPIPLVAGTVGFQLGSIELAAFVQGFAIGLDDREGDFLDADVFARWRLLGGKDHARASLIVGWRQIELDVDYEEGGDDFELELGVSGPYVGLELTL